MMRQPDAAVWRLILFALCFMVWAIPSPCAAQSEENGLVQVEERIVSSKALMTLDVGRYRRVVQISPNGRNMHIQFEIRVSVSAVVMSYHRHTLVDAWYDRQGLVAFISEEDEDGKKTILNGRRERQVGERVVFRIQGMIAGQPVDRSIPFQMIHFTNLENYPFTAALSRTRQTWRVLNLFNGEVELVHMTPEGVENCPAPTSCSCWRVKLWSPGRQGIFHFTGDTLLAHARGDDKLGNFILRTEPPKTKKESGGFFGGFFGGGSSDARDEDEESGPLCPQDMSTVVPIIGPPPPLHPSDDVPEDAQEHPSEPLSDFLNPEDTH